MRYGVVLVTAVVALVATALLFLPLALRHRAAGRLPEIFDGTTSVYAVRLTGGAPKQVLRLHGQWEFPVATSDGKAVILERPQLTGTGVWRIPLSGGRPVHLRELRTFTQPVVRTNGFTAVEKETRGAARWRIDLLVRDGRGHIVWRRQMPLPSGVVSAAPDGRRVVAVRMHRVELVRPRRITLLASDGGQSFAPLWTRDGRSVLYWNAKQQLVVVDVASGARRALVRGHYFENALSADGRTVYVLGVNDAVSIPK